jgi:hypothetical protein
MSAFRPCDHGGYRPIPDISAGWNNDAGVEAPTMTLPLMRLPIAATLGATLMAWRASMIAPEYSAVQTEMMDWMFWGAMLLAVGFFWGLLRWYQRMDRRYLPEH